MARVRRNVQQLTGKNRITKSQKKNLYISSGSGKSRQNRRWAERSGPVITRKIDDPKISPPLPSK